MHIPSDVLRLILLESTFDEIRVFLMYCPSTITDSFWEEYFFRRLNPKYSFIFQEYQTNTPFMKKYGVRAIDVTRVPFVSRPGTWSRPLDALSWIRHPEFAIKSGGYSLVYDDGSNSAIVSVTVKKDRIILRRWRVGVVDSVVEEHNITRESESTLLVDIALTGGADYLHNPLVNVDDVKYKPWYH